MSGSVTRRFGRFDFQAYARLGAEMDAERPGSWVRIDAARDMDAVSDVVWARIKTLARGVDDPVSRLWEGM
ncbi:hypothetical protein HDZ31DRAFT_63356 [Schizophyllum fasciatum]